MREAGLVGQPTPFVTIPATVGTNPWYFVTASADLDGAGGNFTELVGTSCLAELDFRVSRRRITSPSSIDSSQRGRFGLHAAGQVEADYKEHR